MARITSREAASKKAQEPRAYEEVRDEAGDAWLVSKFKMGDRDQWDRELITDEKTGYSRNPNFRGVTLAMCLVGEDGQLLFSLADVGWLNNLQGMEPVFDACLRINRLRKQDLEDAEKNSGGTPNSGSGSTPPTGSAAPSTNSPPE